MFCDFGKKMNSFCGLNENFDFTALTRKYNFMVLVEKYIFEIFTEKYNFKALVECSFVVMAGKWVFAVLVKNTFL